MSPLRVREAHTKCVTITRVGPPPLQNALISEAILVGIRSACRYIKAWHYVAANLRCPATKNWLNQEIS
jgi:hypothetical protein